MNTHYYILGSDHQVIPCSDISVFAETFDHKNRRVAETVIGKYWISTVFLGVNHNFLGEGPPMLFETMVFVDSEGGEPRRCSTWAEAEILHKQVCDEIKRTLEE